MYACGPTVYARGHIGNFRTFVCVDVLRRTLKYLCGHEVQRRRQLHRRRRQDDRRRAKAGHAAARLHRPVDSRRSATTRRASGIEPPEETPRATDEANLRAMGDMILALERNGHTYRRDGSIYFKIASLPTYGRLARLDHEGMKAGASVDVDEYSKDDARDFVLWKATKPGEPTWDYGTGPGRPGWHIECSAMALRLLGPGPIDIHAGGIDLIFPHHENEIAQAEGATKQPFARFWFHVEHLFVENEKMSKSLGNVYTVPDIVARGYRPSALRYLLLSSHYRKQLNFTWAGMDQAEESLRRIVDFLARLEIVTGEGEHARVERGDRARAQTGVHRARSRAISTPPARWPPFSTSCATSTPRSTRRRCRPPRPRSCATRSSGSTRCLAWWRCAAPRTRSRRCRWRRSSG